MCSNPDFSPMNNKNVALRFLHGLRKCVSVKRDPRLGALRSHGYELLTGGFQQPNRADCSGRKDHPQAEIETR